MKYSILILMLVMSIVIYADYDLDKPANISTGSAVRFEKFNETQYLNKLTIEKLVNFLLGDVKLSSGHAGKEGNSNYTSELETNEISKGKNGGDNEWDNHWDNSTDLKYNNNTFTNNTNQDNVNNLVDALTNYKNKFSSIVQLYDASICNGCTSSINNITGELTPSTKPTTDSLADIPGVNLVIYSGRNTTASVYHFADDNVAGCEGTGLHRNMTIATSKGVYHIYSYESSTPIVLDLDGDGKLEASKGQYLPHTLCVPESELVAFDINADGFEELVEWVGANDGLLVHNITNNEVSAKNLFGDATGFKDGFEQLATLDANKDDALTGEELAGLAVWQDKNGNAKIDDGEIHSLESLGITKLNVKAIELTATFERNGKYYMMWDWNPVTLMVKKAK